MAQKNTFARNSLRGLDDFQEITIDPTKEDMSELKKIDLTEGDKTNVPRADVPRALASEGNTNVRNVQNEVTPGQRVQGKTPEGTSEPEEVEQAGKDLSSIGKALGNPAVQKFLGQMGIAFSKGNPNEAGTILGKAAIDNASASQEQQLVSKMLRGEEITEEDMAMVDSETYRSARQQARAEQEQERKEKATEANIEQGERSLGLEQQRVNLQEQAQKLRERGIELDEERFDFGKEMTREEMAIARSELALKEQQAETEDILSRAQAQYYKARAEALRNPKNPSARARMLEARNETIKLIDQRLRKQKTELNNAKDTLEEAQGDFLGDTGDFLEALGISAATRLVSLGTEGGPSQREIQLQEELAIEDAQKLVNEKEKQVQQLEQILNEIQEDQTDALSNSDEDTESGDTEEGKEDELGTVNNPIKVTTDAQWRALETGTIFEARGTVYERVEGGIREVQ